MGPLNTPQQPPQPQPPNMSMAPAPQQGAGAFDGLSQLFSNPNWLRNAIGMLMGKNALAQAAGTAPQAVAPAVPSAGLNMALLAQQAANRAKAQNALGGAGGLGNNPTAIIALPAKEKKGKK